MAEILQTDDVNVLPRSVEWSVRLLMKLGTYPGGMTFCQITDASRDADTRVDELLSRLVRGRLLKEEAAADGVKRYVPARPVGEYSLLDLMVCLGEDLHIVNVTDSHAYNSRYGEGWQKLFVAHTVVKKILSDIKLVWL